MNSIDALISRLYRSTQHVSIGDYREWALRELQTLIQFDSAIWSTGHLSTRTFHTHTTLGLPKSFPDETIKHLSINPITKRLFNHAGEAVGMDEVISDEDFYTSDIYRLMFKPHGIERVLSSIHIAPRSGIYTLLSIYRTKRGQNFLPDEKSLHSRALYHLIEAASHACVLSLTPSGEVSANSNKTFMTHKPEEQQLVHAICDKHGIYHEVENKFLDIAEKCFKEAPSDRFPINLPLSESRIAFDNYVFEYEPLGDLYRVSSRLKTPLDELTERERQVVQGVTNGLSFKQIAKALGLSPSTVSNHLYRIYQKLGITNRSELADLFNLK